MTASEEDNPYASPAEPCEPIPEQWHFLDHYQGTLFLGLIGLGFGLTLFPEFPGYVLSLVGAAAIVAWLTFNYVDRAAWKTANNEQPPSPAVREHLP